MKIVIHPDRLPCDCGIRHTIIRLYTNEPVLKVTVACSQCSASLTEPLRAGMVEIEYKGQKGTQGPIRPIEAR